MPTTVERDSINGFDIDEFNVHGLEEGATQGICPLCSDDRKPKNKNAKCASYDWERGIATCHNCNEVIQLHTFKGRKGETDRVYEKPKEMAPLVTDTKVIEYFKGRGISKETLSALSVSEGLSFMPQTGKEENTIQFNYFIGGELVNIKYRDGRKNFKLHKGAEKVFYNIDSTVNENYVVIVEGEVDALSFHEAGIKSIVSVPNGATLHNNSLDYLDNCIDYFLDKEKIYLALDNDPPGQALQQEFIRRLGAEVCFIVSLKDKKDANEFLIEYGSAELKNAIHTAKPVPLENVTTLRDIEGDVIDFIKNGFKPGFQIGLENFDDIFSTYTKQFITVTGVPSSGKSDFVDQMVVGYNKNYGWKTAFASPENAPMFLHAHKLVRKFWEGMPKEEDLKTEKWKQISQHVDDNFFFIDMDKYDLDSVLRKGAELVKRKGIKCLVIDPFNKVRDVKGNRSDVNEYTMEYLTKIEMFARKHDALVIVVAHPTKMYKDKEGNIEEPNLYNVKGGGEWYDASLHGLLVHRDYAMNRVKVKVLKVKFQNLGQNQAETWFTWDPQSGCFIPYKDIELDDEIFSI